MTKDQEIEYLREKLRLVTKYNEELLEAVDSFQARIVQGSASYSKIFNYSDNGESMCEIIMNASTGVHSDDQSTEKDNTSL